MYTIKNRFTGVVILTYPANTLRNAYLQSANLTGADLRDANLQSANLTGANLQSANLQSANLQAAYLQGSYLQSANLRDANLRNASLRDANLRGATMPDGRTYEAWRLDPLAGLCDEPKARARAIAAWGKHCWTDCPLHAGMGLNSNAEAPANKRILVDTFVALFDGLHLPTPTVSEAE